MPPRCPLPLPDDFTDVDDYVESLLHFSTSSDLFQILCGGVQVLDFFIGDPDPYTTLFPASWREWFNTQSIHDILDLLLRDDLEEHQSKDLIEDSSNSLPLGDGATTDLKSAIRPPTALLSYIQQVRKHSLNRAFTSSTPERPIAREVAVGMKPKKIHEVEQFSRYVDDLADNLSQGQPEITHLVDFGSGQNYLGRALASSPYHRHIIAIESLENNVEAAREMDVTAKLATKTRVMRNKKEYRLQVAQQSDPLHVMIGDGEKNVPSHGKETPIYRTSLEGHPTCTKLGSSRGHVHYVKHRITDGNLEAVIRQIPRFDDQEVPHEAPAATGLNLMVISLHSCGNLVHHGLRALVMNPSVTAVALVGCCYNRMTERLGPETHQLPRLRCNNARVVREANACDPHGFPMSQRLADYSHRHGQGIRLNVTARMMAVQAPGNWTGAESEAFFTRHFFRALFQRILFDRGIVSGPSAAPDDAGCARAIIIGSLRKASYSSFTSYVRAAVAKLTAPESPDADWVGARLDDLSDDEIRAYELRYRHRKLELSIAWSFMAFSAIVAESLIVVDRWSFLREQEVVQRCWVEPVFDYRQSPRNLVVVGVKSRGHPF